MHSCRSIVNARPFCKGACASKKSAAPAKTASGCQRELILSESPGMAQAYATLDALISLSSLPGEHISLFVVVVVVVGKVDH